MRTLLFHLSRWNPWLVMIQIEYAIFAYLAAWVQVVWGWLIWPPVQPKTGS